LSGDAQRGVLLDFVRGEISAVLGHTSAASIEPERGLLDMGFDSLSAIELRNRLSAVTDLRIPPTLAFDHPTPAALARYLHEAFAPDGGRPLPDEETKIRETIASIPLERIRGAGLLEALMRLAGHAVPPASAESDERRSTIEEGDVDELVRIALGQERDN
jgi:acyl carrier protein